LQDDVLLQPADVRKLFGGVSDIWLWRREKDEPAFPKPRRIRGRRFYSLRELRAYMASLAPNSGAA
jgi:predicted DNA-binding transcriptional regulator AlpA